MGKYTNYSMEVIDIDNKGYDAYKVAKYMLEKNNESEKFYAFQYNLRNFIENIDPRLKIDYALCLDSDEETKWYENEDEMLELSQEFPDVLFKLHGEGEESGDIWDKYFMNGKMQYCPAEIHIPEFDRNKLEGISQDNIEIDR